MKSSVELPIAHLELSDRFDFDFVIASTCFEHYPYKEWYMASDRFMILDNGAFEKGEAITDGMYLDLAHELKHDVLVIPDVTFDPQATLGRYNTFMQAWKAYPVPDCELMGVIQCNGQVDVAHMMGNMYYSNGIKWIGVPYISMIDRYNFIRLHPEYENIHILGLPTLPEVISLGTLSNVKSCDSSLPVKCAARLDRIEVGLFAPTHVSPEDLEIDAELLDHNLRVFKATCDGDVRITRL